MVDNHIYFLLSRYITETITQEEKEELKLLVDIADDSELSLYLHRLWGDYEVENPVDSDLLDTIFRQVRKQILKQTFRFAMVKAMRVASILLFPLLCALSIYLYTTRTADSSFKDRQMIVQAQKGQRAEVLLSDGTKVQLNAGSSLAYKQNYGLSERTISFVGEGYFEVAKDLSIPFVVHTKELDIEVLGTVFNLYSYEEENTTELALLSGKVKVSTIYSPVQTVVLEPNEKVVFNKLSKSLEIKDTDNRLETAWLEGNLVFRSSPMAEVIKKIERRYGVSIHLGEPIIENDLFTGCLNGEQISDVMKLLQNHYSFSYKIVDNNLYITSAKKRK